MLTVERLPLHDAAAAARWDKFVMGCDQATFFHRSGWQNILTDVFRHQTFFLFAQQDGELRGVLPLARVKSMLFGSSLVSLPFAVYGGVAALDATASDALELEAQRLAQELGVEHLELRNREPRHLDWPRQDLYVTFRKSLDPDDEANMSAIPRKQRAMVRKGIRNGLTSRVDERLDDFFRLYADNVHRHGTPALPRRYFEALRREFGPDCEVMTVTDVRGRAISSVMSFFFRSEVLPYYAGDDVSARELAGNDFKYWEVMRRAVARGARVFDYGRSKQGTGSFAFKKNWGFEPSPLHYEYRLYKLDAVPQNNPSNPKYRLLIETWRHMPRPMANLLGPLFVRSLG